MTRLLTLVILVYACNLALAQPVEAVLFNFGGYPGDGLNPTGGLTSDAVGNLYGVTTGGGAFCQNQGGCGTVYELSPSAGGNWMETILYSFCVTENPPFCPDGSIPSAGLLMDRSGNLYGTTQFSGSAGHGVVFRLSPPPGKLGSWTETVLWNFASNKKNNGWAPGFGKLNMDASGDIYGTTQAGGGKNEGIVFELSPEGDGTYTFSIVHSFSGPDGAVPEYGVAIDGSGNLYGTTQEGGPKNPNCTGGAGGCGIVYKLTQSSGKWTGAILFKFTGGTNGSNPVSPISLDQAGNLYGTFSSGGLAGGCAAVGCGGVFKLVARAGGGDTEYMFEFNGQNGGTPMGGVLVRPSGNVLYGTTTNGAGNVFSLRGKTETVLYNFCSLTNCADGRMPAAGTLIERSGILYGVTVTGGLYNNSGVAYSLAK